MNKEETPTSTRILVEITKSGYVTIPVPPVYGNMPDINKVRDEITRLVQDDRLDQSEMDLSCIQFTSEDADIEWEEITFPPVNGKWPDISIRKTPWETPWKLDLTVTAKIEKGHEFVVSEIKEELARRLLAADGKQHLETMNVEPIEGIAFSVAGYLPEH